MLTKRIIACLDVRDDGQVAKGVKFTNLKSVGDPVGLAKKYYMQGIDELVFLDINTKDKKRDYMMNLITKVSKEIFIPFTVGGGIKTIQDVKETLRAGADKVSLNRAVITNPELISEAARMFGSQAVVVAIDAKKYGNTWRAHVGGGKIDTGMDVVEWAYEAVRRGAGEILLTSIDRDGTKMGFNLELTKAVSQGVSVPIIASGGAGSEQDFFDVFSKGAADGALAASLFHFGNLRITELKNYLLRLKVPMRIEK